MDGVGLQITTTKRANCLEEEEDKISSLSDCLIIEILSRLPYTKQAIRTSVLSKRWQHLWTFVQTLIFSEWVDIDTSVRNESLPGYFSSVDKSLTQCRFDLHEFQISSSAYYGEYTSSHADNWIRFAINRNVQQLSVVLPSGYRFVLKDDLFFNNSCFTHLTLRGFKFNPTGPIRWNNLRSLNICNARLDEDLIQSILFGSSLLETLKLKNCFGFERLDINSKSVKNLGFVDYIFSPYNHQDLIKIDAPYILSLSIGMSYSSLLTRIWLLDVSSLVKVKLGCLYTTFVRDMAHETEEFELKWFILKCSHVNKIKIQDNWSEVLSRLEAKGFNFPPNSKVPDDTSP